MAGSTGRLRNARWILVALAVAGPGCRMVSRDQVEECHRLSQTLRTENAQLKDQVLALRSQNHDLSDRSVDDIRRMAQLEDVNRQLETSVRAYQDERSRLESAYKELRASLPGSLQPLSMSRDGRDRGSETPPAPQPVPRPSDIDKAVEHAGSDEDDIVLSDDPARSRSRPQGSWTPARTTQDRPIPGRSGP